MKDSTKSEPMDAAIREARTGTPATNSERACYAAQTLADEVRSMFPETPVEYSNYNGRNTALDVSFDLTGMDESERSDLMPLLTMVEDTDLRVREVLAEDGSVLVSFWPSPRTQDSRDSFGLADALMVLAETNWFEVTSS